MSWAASLSGWADRQYAARYGTDDPPEVQLANLVPENMAQLTRLLAFCFHVMLPGLAYPASNALFSLSNRIYEETGRISLGLIYCRRPRPEEGYRCSSHASDPAPVYLITSTLSALESVSDESIVKDLGKARAEQHAEQGSLPERRKWTAFEEASMRYQHWAIRIRGITYELMRVRNKKVIEVLITEAGQQANIAALGLPLEPVSTHVLGTTYLDDDTIRDVVKSGVDGRNKVGWNVYHPTRNNCQMFWFTRGSGLLRYIVCQCPDQPRLQVPLPVDESFDRSPGRELARKGVRNAFLLNLIRRRGWLPWLFKWFPAPWSVKTYVWFHLIMEAMKYSTILKLWRDETVRDVGDFLTAYHSSEGCEGGPWQNVRLTKDSRFWPVLSFRWIATIFAIAETFVSFAHRFGGWPSFEIVEYLMAVITLLLCDLLARDKIELDVPCFLPGVFLRAARPASHGLDETSE